MSEFYYTVEKYNSVTIHIILITMAIWALILGSFMMTDHMKDETNCNGSIISVWLVVYGISTLVCIPISIITDIFSRRCESWCRLGCKCVSIIFYPILSKYGSTILLIVTFKIVTRNTFDGCQMASESFEQKYYPFLLPLIISYRIITIIIAVLLFLSSDIWKVVGLVHMFTIITVNRIKMINSWKKKSGIKK